MKRIGLVVLTVALAGLGCLPHSYVRDNSKPPPVELKETAPPAVAPEGITEKNVAERARQLREELEYESKHQEEGEPAKTGNVKQ